MKLEMIRSLSHFRIRLRQVKYSEIIADLGLDITWGLLNLNDDLSLLQPISRKPLGQVSSEV